MNSYERYKPASADWIDEVPEHWNEKKLKYAVDLVRDKGSDDGPDYQVALENIEGHTGKLISTEGSFKSNGYLFRKGDVLFNKLRPYLNKVALAPQDGAAVGDLMVFRSLEGVDNTFMFYRLLSRDFVAVVNGATYGAKMPRTSWDFVGEQRLPFPPLYEQRAIADYLDKKTAQIDVLIQKRQRLIDLLEEQRTAIISRAVTKGTDPDAELKDSGFGWIGQIPKDWDMVKLKFLSPSISVGVVVSPTQHVDESGTVPYFYGSDISEGSMDPEGARRITEEGNEKLKKSQLEAGDLVTVRVGDPGVTAVVPEELGGSNCASIAIIRKSDKFVSDYLCYCMNSFVGRHQVDMVEYGAAQKQFNIGDAVNFLFPVPPYAEQKQIVSDLDSQTAKFNALITKETNLIEQLKELRQSLISEAVTGKIDVREEVPV